MTDDSETNTRGILLLLLLAASVTLYRSPYNASDLEIAPDSVEYAIGAVRLWEKGQYSIVIEGKALPPRYPPLPSALLVPVYALLGPEPGNGILPVTFMAVVGIGLAWAIGQRVGGPWGGAAAGLALLTLPAYANWGRTIMTDVPACVLVLAACLLYQRSWPCPPRASAEKQNLHVYLSAGVLAALAAALRPVCAAAVLPFLIPLFRLKGRGFTLGLVALFLPISIPGVINLVYNAKVFGHPMRTGYHFWSSIPYDFFTLTFSPRYVLINLNAVWHCGLAVLLGGAGVLLLASRRWPDAFHASEHPRQHRALVEFLALGTGPTVLFHLFYFFAQDRFYLPAASVAAILAAGLIGGRLNLFRPALIPVILGLYLIASLALRVIYPAPPPQRRLAAERIHQYAANGALVISAIDPAYLEHYANPNASRRIIPLSRRVEYASKRIATERISDPALVELDARQAVQFVASEQLTQLKIEHNRGKKIFLETSQLGPQDAHLIREFENAFKLHKVAEGLFEMRNHETTE